MTLINMDDGVIHRVSIGVTRTPTLVGHTSNNFSNPEISIWRMHGYIIYSGIPMSNRNEKNIWITLMHIIGQNTLQYLYFHRLMLLTNLRK